MKAAILFTFIVFSTEGWQGGYEADQYYPIGAGFSTKLRA